MHTVALQAIVAHKDPALIQIVEGILDHVLRHAVRTVIGGNVGCEGQLREKGRHLVVCRAFPIAVGELFEVDLSIVIIVLLHMVKQQRVAGKKLIFPP